MSYANYKIILAVITAANAAIVTAYAKTEQEQQQINLCKKYWKNTNDGNIMCTLCALCFDALEYPTCTDDVN
jgi:hypothetical protein